MSATKTLIRSLNCTGSDSDRWTMPAGYVVTVHRFAGANWAVVLDGRVYRASSHDVRMATR